MLLRRHRLAAGLSQEALAERAGLTAQAVGALERGQRRMPYRDTVRAIAEALGLAIAERTELERAVARTRARATTATAPAPPAAPAQAPELGLPLPPDRLIGREGAVRALLALLREGEVRLITLTGPGGVGKTRLALAIAQAAAADFADGVRFVPLAPVADHRLVAAVIAATLGASEPDPDRPLDAVRAAIGNKQLLLILDNCEQVTQAAPLVSDLVAACPRLTVLATSRIALRARRERRYPVPPLALPDPDLAPVPAALAGNAAVALFVRRAREADPQFALADANAAVVAAICQRLDGLPLALELAAARLALLSPAGLLARLDRVLPLLTGGPSDQPERHRTLRATLAWSYDLLSQGEQAVFRRLAPFVGGWTLAAAEATCGADEALAIEMLDWLAGLIDHSLLRREPTDDDEPRFAMLATVREYAAERLAASGEAPAAHQRHAAYYLALAEEAEGTLQRPAPRAALDRLEREHDNLRAALAWLLVQPDRGKAALRLAAALWRFWLMRGHASEGRGWLDRALAAPESGAASDVRARARALGGASALAHNQGDFAQAATHGEASLHLWRGLADPGGIAGALGLLALARRGQGDYAAATALAEEALGIWRAQGDQQRVAAVLTNLSALANDQGDYARAEGYLTESLALKRALGDTQGIAIALHNLAECARYQGDTSRAATLLEESLALFRELGGQPRIAHALHSLGMLELTRRNDGRAAALLRESLSLFLALDERSGAILCLEGLAQLAAAGGDHATVTRLLACVESQRGALGFARAPVDRAIIETLLARALEALGATDFAAAWAVGRGLALDQASPAIP